MTIGREQLLETFGPLADEGGTLRWRATVPILTNPFLLLEAFQAAFMGAVLALVFICAGLRVMEGALSVADITSAFFVSCLILPGIMAAFAAVSLLCFRNRYFASYRMDAVGVYYEGRRGHDESRSLIILRMRPFPVAGRVTSGRVSGRTLPWEVVDAYRDIPGMRVIILKRGFWSMTRLYTPDAATHTRLVEFMSKRLVRQVS
jgi:hypothetical protein